VSEHLDWRSVLEEHRELLRSLERVERLIGAEEAEDAPRIEIATLRGEIYRLHGALEHHHEAEENSFLRILAADRPELTPALAIFRREHLEIRAEMRAILDRALSQREENLVEDVRDSLIALLARLRDHEHRETQLVRETVARELGVAFS
jgi:hypothetical protein